MTTLGIKNGEILSRVELSVSVLQLLYFQPESKKAYWIGVSIIRLMKAH